MVGLGLRAPPGDKKIDVFTARHTPFRYVTDDFAFFCYGGTTRCPDRGEIWRGCGRLVHAKYRLLHAKFHPIGEEMGAWANSPI